MKVRNVHERVLRAGLSTAGALIDGLSSYDDRLWPREEWPAMKFDGRLCVGAEGGHGPIRYFVEAYAPGRSIRFRFTGPQGFDGYHGYELKEVGARQTRLQHVLEMDARGMARVSWLLVFRPLHDALIEDSLDRAESYCGEAPRPRSWSAWVKVLRRALAPTR